MTGSLRTYAKKDNIMTIEPNAKAPRIALVGGQWAQNVGNAFFNLGGEYVLKRVFGEGAVGFFQDQPNYRTLHNKMKGNPENYIDFVRNLDIDYLVLQGPVLNPWMALSWEKTFKALHKRGVKVILLSCAFFKFRDNEISAVRKLLEAYPPALISTRDPKTFDIIKDWLPDVPKYNGIDSGFFLPRCVRPFAVRPDRKYMSLNFDRYLEPTISTTPLSEKNYKSRSIDMLGAKYYLGVPKFQDWASHKSKIWAYFGELTDRRVLPDHIGDLTVIRPEHRFFPHMTRKIYRHPNATAADEPWTYINIYANSELTLSDRVHACVATLAYGHPAMLFTPSPRAALFERLGLGEIRNQLVDLNLGRLEEEQEKEIEWLSGHV